MYFIAELTGGAIAGLASAPLYGFGQYPRLQDSAEFDPLTASDAEKKGSVQNWGSVGEVQ